MRGESFRWKTITEANEQLSLLVHNQSCGQPQKHQGRKVYSFHRRRVSMKIINKQSIIRIENSFESNWSKPEAGFLDYSEKLFQRSGVFLTVLYLVRTKNIKQVMITFL